MTSEWSPPFSNREVIPISIWGHTHILAVAYQWSGSTEAEHKVPGYFCLWRAQDAH